MPATTPFQPQLFTRTECCRSYFVIESVNLYGKVLELQRRIGNKMFVQKV